MSQVFHPGTPAPSFDLPSSAGGRVSGDDLRGQPYVLVFYPGDFTPVCTSELGLFEQALSDIDGYGAKLYGVSVDSIGSHEDFARAQGLSFPLLSDADPKGAASRQFQSYNDAHSVSRRSLFVIDADGKVVWSDLSPDNVNPGADGVLRALATLSGKDASASPSSTKFNVRGPADAAVTLTEFGDYQCPYCGEAYQELKTVFAHFGDQIRFEFRNFPLTNVHPYAEVAAEVAEAAGAQGKFWQMHDAIYENQNALSQEMLVELARQLGLDVDKLVDQVNDHAYLDQIRADVQAGLRDGVNGTPSFFINGRMYQGSFDAQSFIDAIEDAGR